MGHWQKWLCTVHLGKIVEQPNQSQPTPGLRLDEPPCSGLLDREILIWSMFTTAGPHDERNRGLATGRELPVVLGPALRRETRSPPSPRIPRLVSGQEGNANNSPPTRNLCLEG